MINTALQAIERFESSRAFGEVPLPTPIFDDDDNDSITVTDTEEDTSDDSDEYKDTQEQGSEVVKYQTGQAHIKQTLKDKIKIRRESEGAEEFTTLFEPPKKYELTPEEELKNEIRKHRNRRSANKSRLKRIEMEKKLEEDAAALEKTHAEQTREVNTLKKIKLLLTAVLKRHLPTCPKLAEARNTKGQSGMPIQSTFYNANVGASSCMTVQTTCSSNTSSNLQSKLPSTPNVCTKPNIEQPQSILSMCQSPLKRKATDELNGQLFKKPLVPNQISLAHLNSVPISTAAQTCTNKSFEELWARLIGTATSEMNTSSPVQSVSIATRMGNQCNTINENVLCEIPGTNDNIIHPFSSTRENNNLGRSTAPPGTECDGISGNEHSVSTNVTEQQKINHIKQHLLDGFALDSPR